MPTTPSAASRSSRPPVARQFDGRPGGVAHHVPGDPDPARLVVLVVHPGVADVRRGLDHDLAVVRRVGQRLLVAGHAGGEDRLAERLPTAAVRLAAERPPVLQHQHRASRSPDRLPVEHRRHALAGTWRPPGRAVPGRRTGVLRLRLASAAGSTVQPGVAGRPASGWPARPGASGRAVLGRGRRCAAGRTRHPLGDAVPAEPGPSIVVDHDGQCRLQPEHAGPGVRPLALLVLHRVRGVVGGDGVDRCPRPARPAAPRRRRRCAAAGSP